MGLAICRAHSLGNAHVFMIRDMTTYSRFIRPLAFRLDPETAHHLAIAAGARLAWAAGAMRAATHVRDDRLATDVAGLHFPTPIGLAAGFDKNGSAIRALAGLGFGSIEIGSVSIDPSSGNPKPRLWRLPDDKAIVVHYGLPNDGADVIAKRLARTRLPVPLGINLVVTNRGPGAAPLKADQIIGEYVAAAKAMAPYADYLMMNLSCPNTVDGRDFFADAGHLNACLAALGETKLQPPVFLKVSPLGGIEAIERVLAAADGRDSISGFMFNLPPVKPEGMRVGLVRPKRGRLVKFLYACNPFAISADLIGPAGLRLLFEFLFQRLPTCKRMGAALQRRVCSELDLRLWLQQNLSKSPGLRRAGNFLLRNTPLSVWTTEPGDSET